MGLWSAIFGRTPRVVGVPPTLPRLSRAELDRRARLARPELDTAVAPRLPHLHARVQAEPTRPQAHAALAAALALCGEYPEAKDAWKNAIFHTDQDAFLARCYRVSGTHFDLWLHRHKAAVEHYTHTLDHPEEAPAARLFLAEMALRSDDRRTADKLVAQVTRVGLRGPLGFAESAFHAGSHEEAFEALQLAHHLALLEAVADAAPGGDRGSP